eukprot:364971-Chlamydomonas_euryale.AAC.20
MGVQGVSIRNDVFSSKLCRPWMGRSSVEAVASQQQRSDDASTEAPTCWGAGNGSSCGIAAAATKQRVDRSTNTRGCRQWEKLWRHSSSGQMMCRPQLHASFEAESLTHFMY